MYLKINSTKLLHSQNIFIKKIIIYLRGTFIFVKIKKSSHINNSESFIGLTPLILLRHRLKTHIKSFNTMCQCTKGDEVNTCLCVWNHRIEGDSPT